MRKVLFATLAACVAFATFGVIGPRAANANVPMPPEVLDCSTQASQTNNQMRHASTMDLRIQILWGFIVDDPQRVGRRDGCGLRRIPGNHYIRDEVTGAVVNMGQRLQDPCIERYWHAGLRPDGCGPIRAQQLVLIGPLSTRRADLNAYRVLLPYHLSVPCEIWVYVVPNTTTFAGIHPNTYDGVQNCLDDSATHTPYSGNGTTSLSAVG